MMLYGTVEYGLENEREVRSDWAARMILENGKISFYQVYIDSSLLLVAKGYVLRASKEDEDDGALVIDYEP